WALPMVPTPLPWPRARPLADRDRNGRRHAPFSSLSRRPPDLQSAGVRQRRRPRLQPAVAGTARGNPAGPDRGSRGGHRPHRPDHGWIDGVETDEQGWPAHARGASPVRGLFFVGLHWLHKRKSALFFGVGEDAEHVVTDITGG